MRGQVWEISALLPPHPSFASQMPPSPQGEGFFRRQRATEFAETSVMGGLTLSAGNGREFFVHKLFFSLSICFKVIRIQ